MRLSPIIYAAFILIPLAGGCGNAPSASSAPAAAASVASSSNSASSPATVPLSDRDAIKVAIEQHLRDNKGINMSVMVMDVGRVTVSGDQAQADTEFHLKQGGTSMLITYFLERHGSGWLVIRNQPSNAGQFAHPPMDKIHSGASAATPNQDLPDFSGFLRNHPAPKPN